MSLQAGVMLMLLLCAGGPRRCHSTVLWKAASACRVPSAVRVTQRTPRQRKVQSVPVAGGVDVCVDTAVVACMHAYTVHAWDV